MKYILSLLAVAGCALAQPAITAVLDGGAYTNNVAQGSVFVVKGTGLSAAGFVQATAPSYPTTLNNVQVTFTPASGGAAVNALMAYTYNQGGVNQLAAVLRSTVATGAYDVRVINNGATSAAFRTNVVANKPGIVTASSDGQGQAQATLNDGGTLIRNSDVGQIGAFATRAARPGDYVIFWGTGLGPDTASDTGGSSGDLKTALAARVILNGAEIIPEYAGRSAGYPGLDQVVFILPANVALNCSVSVQVRSNGVLSNLVTIATSAANTTTCPSTSGGGGGNTTNSWLTDEEIATFAARGNLTMGSVAASRNTQYNIDTLSGAETTKKYDIIGGQVTKYSGADFTKWLRGEYPDALKALIPAPGTCGVLNYNQIASNPFPGLMYSNLDAGAQWTSVGPNGTQAVPRQSNQVSGPVYNTPDNFSSTYLAPGLYTFSGPGGTPVGSFSGQLRIATEFVVTNSPAEFKTINRSSPLTVRWTGGESGTYVTVQGVSFTISGTAAAGAFFVCIVPVDPGSFTVPANIMQQLPASGVISGGGLNFITRGSFSVTAGGKGARITPPSGVDVFTLNNAWSWQYMPQWQ